MANTINWKKWVDPLGRNADEFEYMPEEDVKYHDISDDEEEEEENDNWQGENKVPVIITPL